jgi:hypothetical protein
MPEYPELEIRLIRRDTNTYAADVRLRDPKDLTEQSAQDYPVQFDFRRLLEASAESEQYGLLLGQCLLGQAGVRTLLTTARDRAGDGALRVRLTIDPSARKLHRLRWEALRDPASGQPLMRDEKLYFSRYLGSFDMRRVELRSRGASRALVVVANPSGLSEYAPNGRSLKPVQVKQELAWIREALKGLVVHTVKPTERASLGTIREALRREDYDIFCLVCHGALVDDEPRLWLEDEAGAVAVTSGAALEDALGGLPRSPRLVVLVSCQSAGGATPARSEDDGALAALGPRLAAAGVPAVVAMQGAVLMTSAALFLKTFFTELRQHGRIDGAMTTARWSLRDQPDDWAPVLFTRLVDGRLWSDRRAPGGFDRGTGWWRGWLEQLAQGKCVPILGSSLLEPLVGSPADIARLWAERYSYPLASPYSVELPQVAQFLTVLYGLAFPRDRYIDRLTTELRERWPEVPDAPPPEGEEAPQERLLRLLSVTWRWRRQRKPEEPDPHAVLAALPFRRYVTTNPDNLLSDALREHGKEPSELLCRWRQDDRGVGAAAPARALGPPPNPRNPVVYQLFGHLSDPDSLILSEDDYFDYLIGVRQPRDAREPRAAMNAALSNSSLLFLGFRLDDWDFRVFCRFLMATEGGNLRSRYTHVAVQLDPDQGRGLPAASARRFLESYFGEEHKKITVYWGSVEDFIQELNQRWQAIPSKAP